jgi:aryl-alcohol dehydrogenase-like predicted oxidoreductase
MIDPSALSKLGFGTYRITDTNAGHAAALRLAINSGCNLVDTASTYQNGESEALVGQVCGANKNVFIITKGGYILHDEMLAFQNTDPGSTVKISDKYMHSIAPEVLESKLKTSLYRMKREQIDCFLIHNPDYHLDAQNGGDTAGFRGRLDKAFSFLEEQCKKGKIRYYGISSNSLPLNESDSVVFEDVLRVAEQVAVDHHFKFIQFPYNLFENEAERSIAENSSLIARAKQKNIITIGNRPFNSNLRQQAVRLAEQTVDLSIVSRTEADLQALMGLIDDKLQTLNLSQKSTDLPILQTLQSSWNKIGDLMTVNNLLQNHLEPVLRNFFGQHLPSHVNEILERFKESFSSHAQSNMNGVLLKLRQHYAANDLRSDCTFQEWLMTKYFDSGIDCMLAGMRQESYVKQLEKYFTTN